MMDNGTHHQVVQLNTTNSQNMNTIQQQQQHNESRVSGEPDHFLTIRLLMQGKVCYFVFCFFHNNLLFPYFCKF